MLLNSTHTTDDSILFLEAELSADASALDVHGFSSRDAELSIERFLNDRFLDGERVVKLIHGKGEGVLQELAERHLIAHPLVDAYRRAELGPDAGAAIYIKLHYSA